MVVPLDRQKNIKNVLRSGATKLFGVDGLGRAAFRSVAEFVTLDMLGFKADKENAVLEGQPTAPTPDTADKSDRLATTAFVKDAFLDIVPVNRATEEEVIEGVRDDAYVTPAAMAGVTEKATTSVQPSDQAARTLASFGLGSGSAAFQAAMDAGGIVEVPSGEYSPGMITPGLLPSFFRMGVATYPGGVTPLNLGAALTEQFFEGRILYKKSASAPDDQPFMDMQRIVEHNAGNSGFIVPNLALTTYINGSAQDVHWPFLSRIHNTKSTNVNHTAVYGQNWRLHADASTGFAGVFETRDKTYQENPSSGSAGLEVDFFANGTDGNNRRIGINVVTGKGMPDGDISEMGVGVWLTPAHGDPAEGRFKRAVAVDADCDVGFDTSGATFTTGGSAFRMAVGQYFSLTALNDRKILYENEYFKYMQGGVERFRIGDSSVNGVMNNNGPIQINYTQVLSSRKTGWSADIGTARREQTATYSGTASATYSQAEMSAVMNALRDATQTLKALKDDLISHGLLGE